MVDEQPASYNATYWAMMRLSSWYSLEKIAKVSNQDEETTKQQLQELIECGEAYEPEPG